LTKRNNHDAPRFFPRLTESDARRQLKGLRRKLDDRGTLDVRPNENGIYAASSRQADDSPSGYQDAWLRDNAMVAFSQWHCGNAESAFKTLEGLTEFLRTQSQNMVKIIDEPELRNDIQQRPHVRFNAKTLREIEKGWAHAQNDALAYVAWLRFRLARSEPRFQLSENERDFYHLVPPYFQAIRYWEDFSIAAHGKKGRGWKEPGLKSACWIGIRNRDHILIQQRSDDR